MAEAAIPRAGVMGWPVEHSLSPRLHGWWLKRYGIEGSYTLLPVEPENLGEKLRQLAADGFCGVNLTVPHKEAAMNIVDHLDETAQDVGAVNTIVVRKDCTLEGRNTDVYGFAQNLLSAGYEPRGRPVVVLGAGGAARAAVAALNGMSAGEIRLVNRSAARAETLAEIFSPAMLVFSWDDLPRALEGAELLVNATSLGMNGQPSLPVMLDDLPPEALVTDMVYAPLETGLLRAAKARGNRTLDGLGMLLHQARPAFKAFFGVEAQVTEELREYVLAGK